MSELRKTSHLTVSQQQGKPYDFKATCLWCGYPYDITQSNSLQPKYYCDNKCETEDRFTE
jgi:hypothetical protein